MLLVLFCIASDTLCKLMVQNVSAGDHGKEFHLQAHLPTHPNDIIFGVCLRTIWHRALHILGTWKASATGEQREKICSHRPRMHIHDFVFESILNVEYNLH